MNISTACRGRAPARRPAPLLCVMVAMVLGLATSAATAIAAGDTSYQALREWIDRADPALPAPAST